MGQQYYPQIRLEPSQPGHYSGKHYYRLIMRQGKTGRKKIGAQILHEIDQIKLPNHNFPIVHFCPWQDYLDVALLDIEDL